MNEGLLTWVIVLAAFGSLLLGSLIVRRRRTPLDLRPIEAYRVLPLSMDQAVEADRQPHFSLGSSAVGQETTVTALASADLMYYLVRRFSFTRQIPLVTLSDPITLALAGDTLRRAYLVRNNLEAYRSTAVAWFPHGARSMAYAAGASQMAVQAGVLNHILLGTFEAELAFFGEVGRRRDQPVIAHSTRLTGQAVAYAMADHTLIGEELFVGGAYLDRADTLRMGSLIALDTLRWGVIVFGILLGLLYNAVN